MAEEEKIPSSLTDLSHRSARRWVLSGLIGITTGTTLMARDALDMLPHGFELLAAVGAGWAAMLFCAPWRHVQTLEERSKEIRRLTAQVREVSSGDRRSALDKDLINRKDDLGQLSRAIHDSLKTTIATQLEFRNLERRFGHNIRRETDRATKDLRRQVMADPLTGLGNRRALEELMDELVHTDGGWAGRVVAAAIDLDHFKTVNDTLGHEIGDECLVFLADLLKSSLRREDRAVRLGGDEFLVLMPALEVEEARRAVSRLADLFAQMPWPYPAAPRPTLSIGLAASCNRDSDDPGDLLRRADEALYASKRAGRATVTAYQDLSRAA